MLIYYFSHQVNKSVGKLREQIKINMQRCVAYLDDLLCKDVVDILQPGHNTAVVRQVSGNLHNEMFTLYFKEIKAENKQTLAQNKVPNRRVSQCTVVSPDHDRVVELVRVPPALPGLASLC